MASNNPDLSALSAYAGKYDKNLFTRLFKELVLTADGVQVLNAIKSTLKLTRINTTKGIKPYTGKFVSMDGQLKYAERTITVNKAQRDIEIEPEKYRTTWMGEQRPGTNDAANKAIPFAQYVWEAIMKQIAEEVVGMLYWGVGTSAFSAYSGATVYTAGALISFTNTSYSNETQYYKCLATTTAGQSPITNPEKWDWAGNLAFNKGFKAIIADAISTDGFSNVVTTGAITNSTAYAQFTSVWRALPDQYKRDGANMYCSQTVYEYLMDDLENTTKYTKENNEVLYLPKTGKKAILKPVDWMYGSGKIIATPMNNLVIGTDSLSDMNTIGSVETVYTTQNGITFLLGTQIRDLDGLAVNDQS